MREADAVIMRRARMLNTFLGALKYILIAFVIALPVRWFVAQPFVVSGESMAPAFKADEYLVIDKLTYHFQKPERGDVIIFHYPLDPSLYFIKRIVALPGETVGIKGNAVTITGKDGTKHLLVENYIDPDYDQKISTASTTLAKDEYYVLGDNRDASTDSRDWGPLQDKFIVGRVFYRLFPLKLAGFFPGTSVGTAGF